VRWSAGEQRGNMPLHVPNNDTREVAYCGPTAIMAVTGKPLSEVHHVIRRVWGKPSWFEVKGVPYDIIMATMNIFGWIVADHVNYGRGHVLLYEFLYSHGRRPSPYFVHTGGSWRRAHVIAVSDGMACDSNSGGPIAVDEWTWKPRSRVSMWWRFERIGE
jgi:hypothetical protein